MKTTHLDGSAARAMFPKVVGTIAGAELHSGYAILDMGPGAFAIMCRGEFVGCCPTYSLAKRAGVRAANAANAREDKACDAARFGDACATCGE